MDEPVWLKRMQNGSIGEARTRALLMDRFWILERSVDVDGADFLIQRRLLRSNLLDRTPERFGVIQVKFFSTEATTHYIKKEYVHNSQDEIRGDFFVIAHTGYEDNPKSYYLLAEDIKKDFSLVKKDDIDNYKIPGKSLLVDKYEIKSRKAFLDRIEHTIAHVNFIENRRFAAWSIPVFTRATDQIEPKYKEPIHNYYCDIPTTFADLKSNAENAVIKIEEIMSMFKSLMSETDPIKYSEILEDIAYECRNGRGEWNISLSDDIYDPEFADVCIKHRKLYDNLKTDGLLDIYSINIEKLYSEISKYLKENKWTTDDVHKITISLNDDIFTINEIRSEKIEAFKFFGVKNEKNEWGHQPIPTCEKFKWIDGKKIEYFWLPGRCLFNGDKRICEENVAISRDLSLYSEIHMAITKHKYGEDEYK